MKNAVRPAAPAGDAPSPRFLPVADGHRLIHMLRQDRDSGVIVQLIAARAGEGTSSLARDLALVAASVPNLRVLLLDLVSPGNGQITTLREGMGVAIAPSRPLTGPPDEILVHQLAFGGGRGNLHVSEFRGPTMFGPFGWPTLFQPLRTDFDLILIDSPSLEAAYDGVMLAPHVDTNLIVVEAERTRAAEARGLTERLGEVGATIAGVVLNKRRSHIPAFLARHV